MTDETSEETTSTSRSTFAFLLAATILGVLWVLLSIGIGLDRVDVLSRIGTFIFGFSLAGAALYLTSSFVTNFVNGRRNVDVPGSFPRPLSSGKDVTVPAEWASSKELSGMELRVRALNTWFDESRSRFSEEISALNRRGLINLSIGIVTAGIGVLILSIIALGPGYDLGDANTPGAVSNWRYYAIDKAVRLTLVIFIETLAFFFLRVYRSTLDGIKYYQNELTNVESRFAALTTALGLEDPTAMTAILDRLSRTERNFILRQDETTVELEKARQDVRATEDLLQLVKAGFSIPTQKRSAKESSE